MASRHALLSLFVEVRTLVSREDNNYDWSSWDDSADALVEIDSVLHTLRSGGLLPDGKMSFFFIPTGPLQEVSISSGWGDEFCALADRFDAAMALKECACFAPGNQPGIDFQFVGTTRDFAEVTIGQCPRCNQYWLRYFYENEAFTGSGRWFLGAISAPQASNIFAEDAKAVLEGLEWYWYGGSYFNVQNGVSSGTIYL